MELNETSKSSYLSNEELLERIADDLVQMHMETGIDLAYWDTALEIVRRYWYTSIHIEIDGKMSND
jgi:thermostable 8-oxoguanine DNA glycosylase